MRGYAHLDNRFLSAAELAQLLDECESADLWQRTVSRLNGCFAAVSRRSDALLAAVDRLRSIPLFYRTGAAHVTISDSAHRLVEGVGEDQRERGRRRRVPVDRLRDGPRDPGARRPPDSGGRAHALGGGASRRANATAVLHVRARRRLHNRQQGSDRAARNRSRPACSAGCWRASAAGRSWYR